MNILNKKFVHLVENPFVVNIDDIYIEQTPCICETQSHDDFSECAGSSHNTRAPPTVARVRRIYFCTEHVRSTSWLSVAYQVRAGIRSRPEQELKTMLCL
ncbi:hypothetical protein JYU34_005528 [Plutella xylostella]|uniref:Uncharacterized protein n=1 Tax=Plutella xylostella TaxID=51655 RepID=A0ABQ7QTF3_PLUXY|nr:hypothetical protein JYU34_005528 [Plutella xylostella]